ncbi:ATP-binding protein [Desulfofundulus thermocisternus]|uniref:ATP-binding protein n=1 Tax=Desulfofundulus thermocisternus TaxID=42471 RepID=UPI00217DF927|nr:ATP-binding protein [Desulfofundulus thermocisternus]MCS5697284.1 ATP-binding protein [Desulfofundulus thermocisternus]
MSNKLTSYLESQMQALKLKGMLAHYREITEKASQRNLSYTEYLSLLFEEELKRKNEGTVKTKINKACFPFIKTLEEFDFGFQPSLREKEIIALSSLEFIVKKENVIFLGPPGVGKTHLSVALGIKACMAKYRVVFITAQKLLEELMLSARDGSLADKLLSYSRLNLLIIDELGYMPVSKVPCHCSKGACFFPLRGDDTRSHALLVHIKSTTTLVNHLH